MYIVFPSRKEGFQLGYRGYEPTIIKKIRIW